MRDIIKKLIDGKMPQKEELKNIIENRTEYSAHMLAEAAAEVRERHYGKNVYIRGLIEYTDFCRRDCYYCGIRNSNKKAVRYRLSKDRILGCCEKGYELGFRTFVLQGGEDPYFTDERLCDIVSAIKNRFPDCAVTLSSGERTAEGYAALKKAGADRYLLRHETAVKEHYDMLHPKSMSHDERIRCLRDLKSLGFQTGCGFMVGSPYQTADNIVEDLIFIHDLKPDMVGIGPFLPHECTPFADKPPGSADLTVYLLSIIRLLCPKVLLPATTALGTAARDGVIRGIKAGANVVMPNLSPDDARDKYMLYNGKATADLAAERYLLTLREKLNKTGYDIAVTRGDRVK